MEWCGRWQGDTCGVLRTVLSAWSMPIPAGGGGGGDEWVESRRRKQEEEEGREGEEKEKRKCLPPFLL